MNVVELSAAEIDAFVTTDPVAAILFFTPDDQNVLPLIEQFRSVGQSFKENFAFGCMDTTRPENVEIVSESGVVMTPTVIYFRFGKVAEEDVGHVAIRRRLDRTSLAHSFGYTDTWLKLFA